MGLELRSGNRFQGQSPLGASHDIRLSDTAGPATIGLGFGSAWVSGIENGVVYRIDPATGDILKRITVGKPDLADLASDIAPANGSMWVTSPGSRTVVRIDPGTNTVESSVPLPYTPEGLTAVREHLGHRRRPGVS